MPEPLSYGNRLQYPTLGDPSAAAAYVLTHQDSGKSSNTTSIGSIFTGLAVVTGGLILAGVVWKLLATPEEKA